jgi:hypothetical protein
MLIKCSSIKNVNVLNVEFVYPQNWNRTFELIK